MTDELRADFAQLAASLRAYIEWHEDAGTLGFPRAPRTSATASTQAPAPAVAPALAPAVVSTSTPALAGDNQKRGWPVSA